MCFLNFILLFFCKLNKIMHLFLFRRLNILDHMIALMEQYASNLEGLVQERTKQLLDEKKRTDTLLYQMLPK